MLEDPPEPLLAADRQDRLCILGEYRAEDVTGKRHLAQSLVWPDRVMVPQRTKSRRLQTRVGALELAVPHVRHGEPYHPSMFARYQRSERALLVACAEMYFQGVSTRRVQAVLKELGAGELSAMTVSRIAGELDEKLAEFRTRRLDATSWPYLIVDARYEKVRVNGRVVSQAVLVTAGIDAESRREVLDFRVADLESAGTRGELFRSLKARGLRGAKLVVSDAHGGSGILRH